MKGLLVPRLSLPLTLSFGCALLLLLAQPAAQAQSPPADPPADPPAAPPAALVELLAVRATGERRPGDEPAIDPRLERYRGLLEPLPYDRYAPQATPGARAIAQGAAVTWSEDDLGVPYRARITFEPRGDKTLLSIEVTRRKAPPAEGHERVVTLKVLLSDGAAYMIQCVGAFPAGDLLLVVRAARED